MPLPFTPATRQKIAEFTICVSFANLCFLKRWYDLEHLESRSMDYFRTGPSDPTLLIATLLCVGLLALIFYGTWMVTRTFASGRTLMVARAASVLALIYPVETIRRYWNIDQGHVDWGSTVGLWIVEAILLSGALAILHGNLRVLRAAQRVLLMVIFLLPALLIDLACLHAMAPQAWEYQGQPSLPWLPARASSAQGPAPRLIWILFDELDQRLAFDQRPEDLELPELDRLRAESFVGNSAEQTAGSTLPAIPSLFTGRIFAAAETMGARTLLLQPQGSGNEVEWKNQPNLFERAREIGVNAALVGWHHPYCGVLGSSLVDCFSAHGIHFVPLLRERDATRDGVFKTAANMFWLEGLNLTDLFRPTKYAVTERLKDQMVQAEQQKQFFVIRQRAFEAAANPRIGLLFIHVPAPHLYAIYDRKRKDFTLSRETTYWDNVALVDRTVGELRKKLEQDGLWNSTSVLITADHGLRYTLWHNRLNWTPEFDRLLANGSSPKVPFILKLAGESKPAIYPHEFSTVITGDMIMAVLNREIVTPDQASVWLAHHTEQERLSANR